MHQSTTWRSFATESTSSMLWKQFAEAPQRHSHIPDCSYAGYQYSEKSLPDVPEVISVKETGAVGDGVADDTLAFRRAIERAAFYGGGAVFVPEGEYRLSDILYLRHSGIVLRGAGKDRTKLVFTQSLTDLLGPLPFGDAPLRSQYAWCGGLIWVGPSASVQTRWWEEWQSQGQIAVVTESAAQGDTVVQVDASGASRLTPGMTVLMAWENPPDNSLFNTIAGHERMKDTQWATDGNILREFPYWNWPTEIVEVNGTSVTLKQPLRLPCKKEWNVGIHLLGSHVKEVGVEHVTIRMAGNDAEYVHLMDVGYNGIYFNRAMHCWVRGVAIQDAENGIIHASAKNITVTSVVISGVKHHHALALRLQSHDNLYSHFRIESATSHGINTEGLSSGNVWRKGELLHGTFDSHRLMSFDSIRTDITLHRNDGWCGGGDGFGPFLGRRMTHWNIRLNGPNVSVNQPDCMPNGAIVGVQGAGPLSSEPSAELCGRGTVPGYKGCIVADRGLVPVQDDLFEAQLRLRLGDE